MLVVTISMFLFNCVLSTSLRNLLLNFSFLGLSPDDVWISVKYLVFFYVFLRLRCALEIIMQRIHLLPTVYLTRQVTLFDIKDVRHAHTDQDIF